MTAQIYEDFFELHYLSELGSVRGEGLALAGNLNSLAPSVYGPGKQAGFHGVVVRKDLVGGSLKPVDNRLATGFSLVLHISADSLAQCSSAGSPLGDSRIRRDIGDSRTVCIDFVRTN